MGRRSGSRGSRGSGRRQQRAKPRTFGERTTAGARRPEEAIPTPVYRLEKMVLPVGKCGRKLKFASQEDVEKALKQAQANRRRRHQNYVEGRVYWHSTCDGWHMTSLNYEKNKVTP